MSKEAKLLQKDIVREFNTSGICRPDEHYYVSRTIEVEKALAGISKGRYYTLFASRQMGKTTFVQELVEKLSKDEYYPVVISFEGFSNINEEEFYFQFYQELHLKAPEVTKLSFQFKKDLDLITFFSELQKNLKKKFVLIIDEFDGLNQKYLGSLLHIFRKIYFDRGKLYNLHSLVLIGVRNITDVNMDNASPFNTNDEIPLSAFTREQVFDLMRQYEKETGQNFADEVKEAVFYNTQGQPGLTNALCKMLVEDYNPGDKKEIGISHFEEMLDFFLYAHISKNVSNIINKANEYKEKIIELFNTSQKIQFLIDEPWVSYLYTNGAINYEEEEEVIGKISKKTKYIKFANPIYQKKLYNYFRPDLSPENSLYISVNESFKQYINPDSSLSILGILKNYQKYVNQRGSKAFKYAPTRKDGRRVEAVYHYSLDAYMNSVARAIGGYSSVEFPTGNGKADIFFYYHGHRYIIEIKSFTNLDQIEQAKHQAARYAKTEGLNEACLVIFSEVHPRDRLDIHTEEEVEGITIRSVLVNVNFWE